VLGLDGVEIRDFGLVPLLWQPGNEPLTMCNPRYAAPELAANKPSTSSDQYSLAMIYLDMVQEHGSGSNKSSTPVRGAAPLIDFSKFSDQERSILQQALDKDPRKRFASNCQFVEALAEALQRRGIASTTTRNVILAAQAGFLDHLREWVSAQIADSDVDRRTPPPDGSLTTAFIAQLVPGTTPLRLEVFRQEWNADFKSRDGDCSRFFVPLPRTFWQRLRSKVIGVDVDVVTESAARQNGVTRIRAALRPVGCDAKVAQEIHERMGPAILASLRNSFGASLERRSTDRLPFARPIMVRHRRTGQRPVELACEGKDISTHGICFVSPKPLERCAVRVQFSLSDDPKDAPILLRAKIIRCEALNNGSFEVGAQFIQEESK
jgi:PilZ domain